MTGDFGHYKILSEIGRGGMGIVYQAIDRRDKRMVAIKQLVFSNIDPAKEREFRDRFKREAATAARLQHPNIVTVFDVSCENDNYFYVMEFLEGHSLRRELELRGGRMPDKEFWNILRQVVEGLSFAHSMNVVHRDVKPDNIFLLKDGRVKLTDFGIARAADYEQTHLTKTGVMMGTLAYVSPEQLQDAKNVDHRADIFSLGVVTYESLSGQVPFTGEGIAQTIVKIVSQEEKPLHVMLPFINVNTSAAVSKALRKRARERYRTVKEFAKDFEDSLETGSAGTVSEGGDAPAQGASSKPADTQTGWEDTTPPMPRIPSASPAALQNDASMVDKVRSRSMEARQQAATEPGASNRIELRREPPPDKAGKLGGRTDYHPIKPLHIFETHGKEKSKLIEPAVICYRSGRLIVADTATRQVHLYSYDGRWVGDLTFRDKEDSKTRGGSLTKPSGIAVDVRGRIYICDSSDPYVRVFDSRGAYLKDICNIQGKESGIQGIAIDSTGLLYLSDVANGCIQVFQSELGLWMRKVGSKGEGPMNFQLPAGLAIDRLNQIYCADYGTSKIYVFNKSGNFVRSFGGKGTSHGLFNVPRAVAVDNNDKIYVLDSLNHRIQIFGPTGDWYHSFGGRGTEPGKFIGPSDLSIDPTNNLLYVADKGNQRIQVLELCLS